MLCDYIICNKGSYTIWVVGTWMFVKSIFQSLFFYFPNISLFKKGTSVEDKTIKTAVTGWFMISEIWKQFQ